MSLAGELKAAAKSGDATRVVELIEGATEKDRRAARFVSERHGMPRESHAWLLAWLGTTTAREAVSWWFLIDDFPLPLVMRVLRARGKAFLATIVRAFEREAPMLWPVVRQAVREGLIEQPDPGAYTRAFVASVGRGDRWWHVDSVYRALLADEELLDEDVWRIFEVDASSELAGAHVYEQTGRHTLGKPIGNSWTYALTRLAAEGRLDRQRLLDASLAALQRDFRASSVGWYAKLHEALEPTREEREARLDTYLALLASPVPSVVKEGLAGLKALDPPADALARSAAPALTLPQKGIALDVLRLLARAAKDDPSVLATVAEALSHEHADVQERALSLLEKQPGSVDRAGLLRLADAVSPTLRPRLDALTGFAEPAAPEPVRIPVPAQPRQTPQQAIRTRAALEPVGSVDDLVELAAALLEGQGTGDDAERFLDGVSRLPAEREGGFERRTGAIVKRARELLRFDPMFAGRDGAEIVARVVLAWTTRKPPPKTVTRDLIGFLAERAGEVARRAAGRGSPRPLLALPTHAGGWIDPEVFARRSAAHGTFRNRADAADLRQAIVRSSALEPLRVEPSAILRERAWGSAERAVELTLAAAPRELAPLRDRLVDGTQQTGWGRSWDPWGTSDALGIRWALTVVPGDPEHAYGLALRDAVVHREGQAAYGHPELVLEHALDAEVPITETGWKTVAAGLLGRPQEVKRAAVDVVVQSVDDGRFDAERLAAGLAWLVANNLGKPNRLEQPLRDAARVSPLHAAQVARTVVGFAAGLPSTPHGLVRLLELGSELVATTGHRVEGGAERAALERIAGEVSASSKLGRSARALLRS